MRREIEVALMEFEEGGNTIWVHSIQGATVLRIKCSGQIIAHDKCANLVAHSDIFVPGDIDVCIPAKEVDAAPS